MKRICIIGGGISGLLAGALLAREGYRVEIFERKKRLGGRAISMKMDELSLEEYRSLLSNFNMDIYHSEPEAEILFEKGLLKGYKLDLGFHVIGGGERAINEWLSGFGKVRMIETKLAYIREDGYEYPFLPLKDRIGFLPQILKLLLSGEKTMEELDLVPMSETIERYGKGKMKFTLEVFSRVIATVNDLNKISTGETLRSLKLLLRGSSPVSYPRGGLESIYAGLASFMKNKIHLGNPVGEIVVEDNRVSKVVADREHEFDMVISSLLAKDLSKILKGDVPKDYLKNLNSLTGTGSLCAYVSLRKIEPDLAGKTFLFIERDVGLEGNDVAGMIDFMTCLDREISPRNHYLVQAYAICTPEEARKKKVLDKLMEIIESNLEKLMPGFKTYTNWVLYLPVWHLDGVAKTIENKKPPLITPIENLYLVGDCTKAPGIGVNCAMSSAKLLHEIIKKSKD